MLEIEEIIMPSGEQRSSLTMQQLRKPEVSIIRDSYLNLKKKYLENVDNSLQEKSLLEGYFAQQASSSSFSDNKRATINAKSSAGSMLSPYGKPSGAYNTDEDDSQYWDKQEEMKNTESSQE